MDSCTARCIRQRQRRGVEREVVVEFLAKGLFMYGGAEGQFQHTAIFRCQIGGTIGTGTLGIRNIPKKTPQVGARTL